MKNKLLIIGPLPNKKLNLGFIGTPVLMSNFTDYLDDHNLKYTFVQTNKYFNVKTGNPSGLKNKLYFLSTFMLNLWNSKIVMFNFSDNSTIKQFPLLCKLAKVTGKKIVFRKFAGSLEFAFNEISEPCRDKVINAFNSSDLLFFETKEAVQYAKSITTVPIKHLPNVRKPSQVKRSGEYKKKLVFVSRIARSKGIDEIIDVAKKLPKEYSISLYGQIMDDYYNDIDFNKYGIKYHGRIDNDQVLSTLSQYDILLLPSKHREGIPGIILEAFSVGLPCIATNVGGIPELITDGANGRLFEMKCADDLLSAILSINDSNFMKMSNKAYENFLTYYDSDKINDELYNTLMNI